MAPGPGEPLPDGRGSAPKPSRDRQGTGAADRAPRDIDRTLEFLAWRVLGRELNDKEREIARAAYRDYLTYYDAKPKDARKLIETGDTDPDSALTEAELAAVTMLANQFLNLDEALTK